MGEQPSTWRRGIWRSEVELRVRDLRHRLAVAEEVDPHDPELPRPQPPGARAAALTAIEKRLDEAEGAMADASHTWDRLKDWWTGAPITAAWGSVHQAEADMVLVERKEDVRANLPWLLAWIQSAMESGYRRSWHEKRLKAQIEGGALDLTAIRQAFKDVIVANTDRYSNLRAFRNTLVLVTAMLATLVAALAIWHLLNRDFLSLCTSTGPKAERCLSGERSRPVDVALVALVGAVGGLLAIAFGLSKTEVAPSRYDPKA